jgi:hypothetical protein
MQQQHTRIVFLDPSEEEFTVTLVIIAAKRQNSEFLVDCTNESTDRCSNSQP